MKVLTEKNKFERIKKIVSEQIKLKIYWNKKRKDPYPNGCYDFDRVLIYSNDKKNCEKNISLVASMILHEYAHHILRISGEEFKMNSEIEIEEAAWSVAKHLVSKHLIPKHFDLFKNYCLESYRQKN